MDDQEKDRELGQHAERLIGQIEADFKYDEEGKAYFLKTSILNLISRVSDFMSQLSKRI